MIEDNHITGRQSKPIGGSHIASPIIPNVDSACVVIQSLDH
jgi:hypothetical protein